MRKKIKIGDKVYCVYYYNDNLEIEEREIIYIKDNKYYLYDEDFINNKKSVVYNKDRDLFLEDDGDKTYYRTKKKAIQEAIKNVKSWIKSFQGSILEHKELLKELKKELI